MLYTCGRRFGSTAAGLMVAILVAGCGSTAAPATTPVITPSPVAATPVVTPTAAVTPPPATGPANLDAPSEVPAGSKFTVNWTGPNAARDYVTIVAAGAAKWTDEPYFYTTVGPSGSLVAPTTDGAYALWYVSGADDTILARRALRVTPFAGTLTAPDSASAASKLEVAWTGPNGPGDYVTIVAAGAARWTNENYFYTTVGSPGTLVLPLEAGAYELWYVTGGDSRTMVRRAITLTPVEITLAAPAAVNRNATFQVTWTGPNGPQDYITIVPAGSPEGTYASYAYTATGNPVTITAPSGPGNYEIWYASDRIEGTFKSIPIVVR